MIDPNEGITPEEATTMARDARSADNARAAELRLIHELKRGWKAGACPELFALLEEAFSGFHESAIDAVDEYLVSGIHERLMEAE